jgi:signal transduction histidine kinase
VKLRAKLILTALLVALPVAFLVDFVAERVRAADRRAILERIVASQLVDDVRARCESNPNWYLAGPRPDRPTAEQLSAPDADVTAPRPPTLELPFEYFAYDDNFQPLSTAGPRFPQEFKNILRSGPKTASGPFATSAGTGQQQAVLTEWNGPCRILLFRLRPLGGQTSQRMAMLGGLFAVLFVIAVAAGAPVVARVRRLHAEARRVANEDYKSQMTISGHDEASAIAFAFNEAATAIRDRTTDVKDREESLRRYIAGTGDSVSAPLLELEERLSHLDPRQDAEVKAAAIEAHTLAMRLQNLSAAATLKMSMSVPARETVDLQALVRRVVDRQTRFARAAAVDLQLVADPAPSGVCAQTLRLEQSVSNLVDNAIRHNRAGGHVVVTVDRTRDGRFSLRVDDDGPGAPDEMLTKLNANRRFRGDEGRARQPGEIGLGLAIVREAGDRLDIKWAFRRSAKGWFQAELTGATIQPPPST